jgi:signal transduction histidine kinase
VTGAAQVGVGAIPVRRQGSLGRRLVFSFVTLALLGLGGSGWVLYRQALTSLEEQLAAHLVAEAELVATELERGYVTRLQAGMDHTHLHHLLQDKLREMQTALRARRIYVFDHNGRSLVDTEEGIRIGREVHLLSFHRRQVEAVWRGDLAHTERFTDEETGDHYMTGYAPIYSGTNIVAAVGVDIGAGYMDAIVGFKRSVFLLAGLGTLLTLFVGVGVARHITRPVKRLVTAAREIGRGNLMREIRVEATDEIGYLGETMEEMRRKLLARDAELRQMLAGVAHEIRNPLSGIEIYAGLIADELPDDDPRKAHIHKVSAEVRTLNLVISEFLDFARPSSPQPEDVPLSLVVEDAAFLLSPEMDSAGVTFRGEVSAGVRVHADAEQVKRAVVNLMKNGVQAMADGGTLTVRARHVGDTGDQVAIEVEDTGPGVPEEVRRHLFEPFFTTRERGSGLGLAIVQKTAETNAGHVEVDSQLGRGTIFRLVLPAVRGSSARGEEI